MHRIQSDSDFQDAQSRMMTLDACHGPALKQLIEAMYSYEVRTSSWACLFLKVLPCGYNPMSIGCWFILMHVAEAHAEQRVQGPLRYVPLRRWVRCALVVLVDATIALVKCPWATS